MASTHFLGTEPSDPILLSAALHTNVVLFERHY